MHFAALGPDRVGLLGGFRLTWHGRDIDLPFAAQRVVAYLALVGTRTSRRSLAVALWPDAEPDRASGALRTDLWRIHRIVPNLIHRDRGSLLLGPTFVVDARELDRVIHFVRESPERAGGQDLDVLTAATDLLAEWDDDWVLAERGRIHTLRLEALDEMARHAIEAGHVQEAIEAGLAAVADEPYRESSHRVLIEAHLKEGNVAAALEQYGQLEGLLRADLGVSPSEDLIRKVEGLQGVQRRLPADLPAPDLRPGHPGRSVR